MILTLALPASRRRDRRAGQHAGEDGLKAIIIGLRDRIEFVVVAAGAAERQAEERRAGHVRQIVEILLPPRRRSEALSSSG